MGQALISNKKVFRDFFVKESWECGIELKGTEVKSLRDGQANFTDSFARIEQGQVILYNFHINPYKEGSYLNVEPARPRKLLLHKKEIKKIVSHTLGKSVVLVPTKLYFNARGFAKLELVIGQGKKQFDKRDSLKKKDVDRQLARTLRVRQR